MVRNASMLCWLMTLGACATAGSANERFTVRAPTDQWEQMEQEPAKEGEVPPLLVLRNGRTRAVVRFDEVSGATPGQAAIVAMGAHERAGLAVVDLDFSDPRGDRVSFRFNGTANGATLSGKVMALRVSHESGAVVLASGVWPRSEDAATLQEFDALMANAKVVKPWW